jgi:hypothetical protein
MTPELIEAYRFHKEHAGYSTPPGRAACALEYARAEIAARNLGWHTLWADDEWGPDSLGDHAYWCATQRRVDAGYDTDGERTFVYSGRYECDHEITYATLYGPHDPLPLASLGGIIDADRDYRRVVGAELALEAFGGDVPASALYACWED